MVGKVGVDELVSRERKIFRFLVFYLVLAVLLAFLFVISGFWTFMETAIAVLAIEIFITNHVNMAKPLNTKPEVEKELSKIRQIDEYKSLREEYLANKDSTVIIAMVVYSLGSMFYLFFMKFSAVYLALFLAGMLILYFSVYLFFRYKIDKVTVILLQRRKAIREMNKAKKMASALRFRKNKKR